MTAARLLVLASGGGRTLENLAAHIRGGTLDARIVEVIVSRAEAAARGRARRLGLPCRVIGRASHPDPQQRDAELLAAVHESQADWVILAGWLLLFPLERELEGRVLNIHPALLPAYGGRGCYGMKVHEAVLRDRPPLSGCTVHFASAAYDQGPILLQEAVELLPQDDAPAVAARVFEAEKRVLVEALRLLLQGRARYVGGRVEWR